MLSHIVKFLYPFQQAAKSIHDSIAPIDLDGSHPVPALLCRKIEDIDEIARRGSAFTLGDLPAYIDAARNLNTVGLDDRKFLLEKLLVLMSRLPDDSVFSKKLEQFVIGLLYEDLPHPPSGYICVHEPISTPHPVNRGVGYVFRSPNGSNYNPLYPSIGQARTPYARSVPSTVRRDRYPDAGLLFDTLLRRNEFVPHPGGISSLFFAFADLVIHSIFSTNRTDNTVNDASSYLDLSPLYGSSDEEIDRVRRKDGLGMIWNDVFGDSRLLFMPPSVCAILILLSRNHNHIAQAIFNINERGGFSSTFSSEMARLAQDDEIFHRARLVNCGFFVQIILGDYVGVILGLVRDGLGWRLDPLKIMRDKDHKFVPQGQGNAVSIEFNLLYRWHAAMSAQDAKWTEDSFGRLFEGKDISQITVEDFKSAAHKYMKPAPDVRQWTFNGLQRDASGRFNDSDLANILHNATEWPAGAFGARGTPQVLRVIEILSIEQARSWGTCSLNEFRKFMGLRPYSSFKEWNPDPEIHIATEALYKDIDNLELHVGLQAEEVKQPAPGAGLCPGFTQSRAILADAVNLVRGDRFLTVELTPFNLTTWGYQDIMFDKLDGSYGGMFTKLLFRTLPEHYPPGSAYAHFPFLVPTHIEAHMSKLPNSCVSKYIWSRPAVPKRLVTVDAYGDVLRVLTESAKYISPYDNRMATLIQGTIVDRPLVKRVLLAVHKSQEWDCYFFKTTEKLIKEKSVNRVGPTTIDIVKDVINMLPVYWIAEKIVGLSLKTTANPTGTYREQELYDMLADVGSYVSLNPNPVHDWALRESAQETTDQVVQQLQRNLDKINRGMSLGKVWHHHEDNRSHGFLKKLLAAGSGRSLHELSCSVVSEVIPTAARYSQVISHLVNFFLDNAQQQARHDMLQLMHDPGAEAQVLCYIREALRLDPSVSSVYRMSTVDSCLGNAQIRAGEGVLANIARANTDVIVFGPDPLAAVYNRPEEKAGIFCLGESGLLSNYFEKTAPEILRVILSLKGVQKAPGPSGELNSVMDGWDGGHQQVYINSNGRAGMTPWPTSLILEVGLPAE